jgi:hypothetical protein
MPANWMVSRPPHEPSVVCLVQPEALLSPGRCRGPHKYAYGFAIGRALDSGLDKLSEGKTKTASRLSEKAVVLLEPVDRLGTVVWPIGYDG